MSNQVNNKFSAEIDWQQIDKLVNDFLSNGRPRTDFMVLLIEMDEIGVTPVIGGMMYTIFRFC